MRIVLIVIGELIKLMEKIGKWVQHVQFIYQEGYPQLVLKDRGYTWNPANLENMTQKPTWETMYNQVLGHIPQVEHTYALVEG